MEMEPDRQNAQQDPPLSTTDRIQRVWKALETVTDPEIPVVSVVEMGMIADVHADETGVVVAMTPTFVGCPALDLIRENIRTAVTGVGEAKVTVNVVFDPPWTTDRISERGRKKLKEFGLAPPQCGTRVLANCGTGFPAGRSGGSAENEPNLEKVPCPYCDGTDTEVDSIFGPTLCRSIHYCRTCQESFEHFKPV